MGFETLEHPQAHHAKTDDAYVQGGRHASSLRAEGSATTEG